MTAALREQTLVLPDDAHNRTLVSQAHPLNWVNPRPAGRYNLVVIGAGTAGLVSAVGAASLGAKVAIVERHLMGGDCLNFGCVPSKAIISAGRVAETVRTAGPFGIKTEVPSVDFAAVMERMRARRAELAPNDSASRLAGLGVDVYLGAARFSGSDTLEIGGDTLRFSRAVIATGARAAVPHIPGLVDAGFQTNETIFSLTSRPDRLVVIGAGPIGCELAQAFRRLGSAVTIIGKASTLMPREDADAAGIVERAFVREGITVVLNADVRGVLGLSSGARTVAYEVDGQSREIEADEILVATGRTPNVDGLNLEAAGVAADARGVTVNDRLRTTNPRVYAAGDICSVYKFTHAADAMARIVLHNALFFGRKGASALVIPWATYTDPEVAHVGMSGTEAEKRRDRVETLTVPLTEVDRAVLEDQAEGFARVHVDRRSGRILGATMVASHAGELISEIALAMRAKVKMSTVGFTVHPYPTQSEAWKRLGDAWNRGRLSPRVRGTLAALLRWRR